MYCREIVHPADLQEVQALRYAVLVEEMGRLHPEADPQTRRLAEPLDRSAIHVGAFERDADGEPRLIGALRIHVPGRGDLEAFAEFHPAILSSEGPRTGVVSRLVTAQDARGGRGGAGLALAIEAYRFALAEQLEVVEIDCHASLVGFFEWLGFVVTRRFEHPVFGDVALLRIRPFDRAALAEAKSVLVDVFDAWAADEGHAVAATRAQA